MFQKVHTAIYIWLRQTHRYMLEVDERCRPLLRSNDSHPMVPIHQLQLKVTCNNQMCYDGEYSWFMCWMMTVAIINCIHVQSTHIHTMMYHTCIDTSWGYTWERDSIYNNNRSGGDISYSLKLLNNTE